MEKFKMAKRLLRNMGKQEKEINDVLDNLCVSGATGIIKEAADKAVDSASINNKELIEKIERENRTSGIFHSGKSISFIKFKRKRGKSNF